MKNMLYCLLMMAVLAGCKKSFNAEPTYAKETIANTWAKNEPFYRPLCERFDEATGNWRTFQSFTVTSEGEPDKIGFANPYVPGKGTNALAMNTIYIAQNISSDSGYFNITIPKCFQFIPKAGDAKQGQVLVLAQDVVIWRKDGTSFVIKIAPAAAPGTYNINTKVFEVEVSFDETSIGGQNNVVRKFRYTAT